MIAIRLYMESWRVQARIVITAKTLEQGKCRAFVSGYIDTAVISSIDRAIFLGRTQ
jgi:hypothetical protein